jgi:hypothetical protein
MRFAKLKRVSFVAVLIRCWIAQALVASLMFARAASYASDLDSIGLTLLRASTTNLDGSGVKVVQAEVPISSSSPPPFEINPGTVGRPVSDFTYFTGPPTSVLPGSSSTYPNSLGSDSGHAGVVGGLFYGLPSGVSTNVAHVDNYEANYFFLTVVPGMLAINAPLVNQSFIAPSTNAQQQAYDSNYDNYSAQYSTLFVSGVGNGGPVSPPSSCYNGIGVGAYHGGSSVGPTLDNGRAKPDIVAPGAQTSYSTPLVSGAAAILLQAGLRGDGGSDSNSAADPRTIKALLLNGAIKPVDWSNPSPSPLDPRYGSGVLNVFNAYKQLAAGKHGYIESGSVSTGNPHPPLGATGNVSSLSGWDFNSLLSSALSDGINHYYINLVANPPNATFTGTITLVWNRQAHQIDINNLDLFLYDAASGTLIAASTSLVDNVEHLCISQLPQGRYDLQVLKHGGATVSSSETYALAFEFFALSLTIAPTGTGVALTWPAYPTGFVLESAPSLNAPTTWTAVNLTPLLTNQQNRVVVNSAAGAQFFRLSRP